MEKNSLKNGIIIAITIWGVWILGIFLLPEITLKYKCFINIFFTMIFILGASLLHKILKKKSQQIIDLNDQIAKLTSQSCELEKELQEKEKECIFFKNIVDTIPIPLFVKR